AAGGGGAAAGGGRLPVLLDQGSLSDEMPPPHRLPDAALARGDARRLPARPASWRLLPRLLRDADDADVRLRRDERLVDGGHRALLPGREVAAARTALGPRGR